MNGALGGSKKSPESTCRRFVCSTLRSGAFILKGSCHLCIFLLCTSHLLLPKHPPDLVRRIKCRLSTFDERLWPTFSHSLIGSVYSMYCTNHQRPFPGDMVHEIFPSSDQHGDLYGPSPPTPYRTRKDVSDLTTKDEQTSCGREVPQSELQLGLGSLCLLADLKGSELVLRFDGKRAEIFYSAILVDRPVGDTSLAVIGARPA